MSNALERAFPGLTGRLPRAVVTQLPTPATRLAGIERELGHPSLWIKRDDLSAAAYGGNKPRKLEYILGAARARGSRVVLTTGGTGTHHGMATAIFARELGMRAILVLLHQPWSEHVRHSLLLDQAVGAELHYTTRVAGTAACTARLLAREALAGNRPTLIPTGGSSPLGTVGYVDAAVELAEQVRDGMLPEPRAVYVAAGTAGTLAGLALGFRLAGIRSRLVGVVVTDLLPPSPKSVARLAMRTLALLRREDASIPRVTVQPEDLSLEFGYCGAGYGEPTPAGSAAIALAHEVDGIQLESTYTGKCMAAFLDRARQCDDGAPLLFWNTYNSVDLDARYGPLPQPTALPPEFHALFRGSN